MFEIVEVPTVVSVATAIVIGDFVKDYLHNTYTRYRYRRQAREYERQVASLEGEVYG